MQKTPSRVSSVKIEVSSVGVQDCKLLIQVGSRSWPLFCEILLRNMICTPRTAFHSEWQTAMNSISFYSSCWRSIEDFRASNGHTTLDIRISRQWSTSKATIRASNQEPARLSLFVSGQLLLHWSPFCTTNISGGTLAQKTREGIRKLVSIRTMLLGAVLSLPPPESLQRAKNHITTWCCRSDTVFVVCRSVYRDIGESRREFRSLWCVESLQTHPYVWSHRQNSIWLLVGAIKSQTSSQAGLFSKSARSTCFHNLICFEVILP